MDQEFYMGAALLWLQPQLTAASLQYRADSQGAAAKIALQFGYDGLMFAWTSAFKGNPFGCCGATGGYEDCLEQHITPDVAFSFMQYFHATRNVSWLEEKMPVIVGIANFVVSRATLNDDGSFSIRKLLPIDEWCDDPATGCLRYGIDDDLQMNAISRLALEFAVEASTLVGSPPRAAWASVAAGLRLLFDVVNEMHIQFQGFTPDLQPSHFVCPEDVLYTTWPMGPYLNTSVNVSLNDAQFYVPLTCLENAGMTGPIQTIAWLRARNLSGAHFAFNRSMLAATYGPFGVRNEVDKHQTTVGGHFDNTHFLTGDGGFINAIVAGYMGLEQHVTLRMHAPQLPESVTTLALVGLHVLGGRISYSVNATALTVALVVPASSGAPLCITYTAAGAQHVLAAVPITIAITDVSFPASVGFCV